MSGVIFMLLGVIGKFGAVLTTVPDPIVGGINLVAFGLVFAVGLSNLQYVDMTSSRNLMIVAVSHMLGLTVPFWLIENPGVIHTGQLP